MNATTDRTAANTPATEAETASAKRPLGRPHDVLAVLGLTLSFAAIIYVSGNLFDRTEVRPWAHSLATFACVLVFLASVAYFYRAYGFTSRGLRHTSFLTRLAVLVSYIVTILWISPALHELYGGERELTLVLSCLAIAALAVLPFHAALGRAPGRMRELSAEQVASS